MSFYNGIRVVFTPIIRVLFRVHVKGRENVPDEGGLLICPNHISASDVIFLTLAVKNREIHYMSKAELFKVPILKRFMTAMGAFPINRGAGDVAAIKKTIKYLRADEVVGMFPQGTRFTGVHPRESSVKSGVGMIAWRSGVSVLPVAIKTKKYKIALFRRVDVIIGKPISCEELGFETGNHTEQDAAAEKIFAEMLKLHEVQDDN